MLINRFSLVAVATSLLTISMSLHAEFVLNGHREVPMKKGQKVGTQQSQGVGAGGGGGLINPKPISVGEVRPVLNTARFPLRLVIREMERSYTPDACTPAAIKQYEAKYPYDKNTLGAICGVIFHSPSLWEALEKTNVEIENDKPCYDSNHGETDASIYGSRPNTICISAYRIAPKLFPENASKEILALMLHELSHIAGANEDQAVAIQEKYIDDFDTVKINQYRESVTKFDQPLANKLNSYYSLVSDLPKLSDSDLLARLSGSDYDLSIDNTVEPIELFGLREQCHYEVEKTKLEVLKAFLHTQVDDTAFSPEGFKSWSQYLGYLFNGGSSATFGNLLYTYDGCGHNKPYSDTEISKVTSRAEAEAVISDLARYMRDLYGYEEAFDPYYGSTLADVVNDPWVKSTVDPCGIL